SFQYDWIAPPRRGMDRNLLIGDWDAGFREFSIAEQESDLVLRCPEAPVGYESRLTEVEDGHFRVEGGPFDEAEVVLGDDGSVSFGGHVSLRRLDREAAPAPGAGLESPMAETDPEEDEAFEHVWNFMAHPSHADEVDLGGLSMVRFLSWLTGRKLAVFHGTNRIDVDRLEPAEWPHMNVGSVPTDRYVYGGSDAFCSMFFALMDEAAARTGRSEERRVGKEGRARRSRCAHREGVQDADPVVGIGHSRR